MIKRVKHIGIAIADLDQASDIFARLLGREPGPTEEVYDQKVKTSIFKIGDSRLELLVGIADDSPISIYTDKKGPGIHHICLEVDDIEAEIRRLEAAGFEMIDHEPRVGVEGALTAFIHPRSTAGILVELSTKK